MALALFDLDNTLLDGDSDFLWGEFLVEQGAVARFGERRVRSIDPFLAHRLGYLQTCICHVPKQPAEFRNTDRAENQFRLSSRR